MAKSVMEQVIAYGEVKRGRIGVQVQDLTPELAEGLGFEGQGGAVVSSVEAHSPAAKAGLAKGDVVTAIDATPIRSASHLRNIVGLKRAGTVIEITCWRKGASVKTVSVRIEPAPAAARQPAPSPG